ADWDVTKRHYEPMARYVHPHFQASRTLRHASYDFAANNADRFRTESQAAVQAAIDRHNP
ncbi:MAG TPA: hypothetical protein VIZ17_19390, partial [Acetobacteraceae bacterium]